MKKLLSILAVGVITGVASAPVVACNKTESNNLSRVKQISAPATVKAKDATKVTKVEIKKALESNALKAVQDVVKTAQATDFVYEVYKDNKGGALETVNLEADKVYVYVQITPAKDKTVVIGKSEYIKVILSKHSEVTKVDISYLTVPEQTVKIKAVDQKNVLKTELEAVNTDITLVEAVLDVIKGKVPSISKSEFTITNNGDNNNYSTEKTIEVTVKANDSSTKIIGQLKFNAKVTAITIQA